jgi:ARID/BRIGHT DNA binding domain
LFFLFTFYRSIGLRPSDPTVLELPDELPSPLHPANCNSDASDVELIDLSEWTQERLNDLAATTAPKDPFSTLLSEPPAAPKDRLGRFTGQQDQEKLALTQAKKAQQASIAYVPVAKPREIEKKREKKIVSVAAPVAVTAVAYNAKQQGATATLDKYISVGLDVPWYLIGKQVPLRAVGKDIPVISLWTAVQKLGGFHVVGNSKLWNAVGRELGCDTKTFHNVHIFREAYAKYLLPYEVFLKHKQEEEEEVRAGGALGIGGSGGGNSGLYQ